MQYFHYCNIETDYLKSKDDKLAYVIDRVGHISRTVDADLFLSIVHHIIGQQISTNAQATIWTRLIDMCDQVTPENLSEIDIEQIRGLGINFRKAEYIKDFTNKVISGEFDVDAVCEMEDEEAIRKLVELKGVGRWMAEMILLFCLQRPDILSFDDLAIQRGMRMTFHHRNLDRVKFEKYRRKFSPYNSVASLYFWAVSGGAVPELKDLGVKLKNVKRG